MQQFPFVTLLLSVFLTAFSVDAHAWWNEDWEYRKRIDINKDATGFPEVGIADATVLVRLDAGNFQYFLDAAPNGEDIRFIAADDVTPLDFHIERFDGIAGVAAIWVKVPRLDPTEDRPHFWMYYGNEEAEPAGDSAASFDVNQTAAYHFNEASGLPADATAFGHVVTRSSALPGRSGLVDTGIQFDVTQNLVIPTTPALTIDAERGTTISFWLRPEGRGEQRARVFSQGTGFRLLSLGLNDLTLDLEFIERNSDNGDETEVVPIRVDAATELQLNRWHHVVVTISDRVRLWVDGEVIAQLETGTPMPRIGGDIVLGSTDGTNGFRGSIDELRLASAVRPDAWIQFAADIQAIDSQIIVAGEDESRSSAGGFGEYFALLWALLGAVRVEGWVILVSIVIMGMLSADVMLNKYSLLKKVERADAEFMNRFEAGHVDMDSPAETDGKTESPLGRLHHVAGNEWRQLKALMASNGNGGNVPAEALEVIRSALDTETVEQIDRMTSRLVLMTVAVSGGPFLGLLGTVVGVMITFATIAAAGDVNVNTIAPGVSAALTTTVMGLLVAIPSLFAYNHITSRISKRTTAMEVFSDRLVARFALAEITSDTPREEVPSAA